MQDLLSASEPSSSGIGKKPPLGRKIPAMNLFLVGSTSFHGGVFYEEKDTSRCGAWTSANRKPIYPVALKQADGTFTRASLRLPFTHTCQG
ncbi:hypothetical protein CDAR_545851 [Caerostris darwini]|uniref:Uncharacterized protein n=1 Tax=Caerostris darwini TaxID=1538125 RepID=A0AAV4WV75_9ARAC|nr:hypothetical protein CDAR_545851 [Caerostris darwini]